MWATKLLAGYLEGEAFRIVLEHSRHVADLALEIAGRMAAGEDDRTFIEEAALLHDIGVCRVNARACHPGAGRVPASRAGV